MQSKSKKPSEASAFDFTTSFGINRAVSYFLGLRSVEMYCKTLPITDGLKACVDQVALDRGLNVDRIKALSAQVPRTGALLITANHPTGILDGVVLLCGLLSRRDDVLIVANDVLSGLPMLGQSIIPIKKTVDGDRNGLSTLIQVRRAWKQDQCVVVFPAGTVSYWQWSKFAVCDAPWTFSFQKLALSLDVPVCKAHLSIQNPTWFHLCCAFSRKARLIFLLRVFMSNSIKNLSSPISFKT